MFRYFLAILVGTIAALLCFVLLPKIPADITERPNTLGRINATDIDVFLGNVAVPNRLIPTGDNRWLLESRLSFWDSFLTTAPAPKAQATPGGIRLEVPWTLLPSSVLSAVSQLDPNLRDSLGTWLELHEGPASWSFARLSRYPVPADSRYAAITGMRAIYSVNLFEFLKDLGPDYRASLASAVSNAVLETLQEAGRNGDHKIAIPAIAAAQNVADRELVISYSDSFSAILDGVERVQANSPSRVVLVVWRDLEGSPELPAALLGLRTAAFRSIPEWRDPIRQFALLAAAIGLVSGLLYGHLTSLSRPPLLVLTIAALGVLAAVLGHKYVEQIAGFLPVTSRPHLDIGLLTAISVLFGGLLYKLDLVRIETKRS
ncbi:MAG: hypothetical protein AB7G12_13805 [Thermoanaerobaculia bacterium]